MPIRVESLIGAIRMSPLHPRHAVATATADENEFLVGCASAAEIPTETAFTARSAPSVVPNRLPETV
jgi:hypothetical protein